MDAYCSRRGHEKDASLGICIESRQCRLEVVKVAFNIGGPALFKTHISCQQIFSRSKFSFFFFFYPIPVFLIRCIQVAKVGNFGPALTET